MRLSGVFCLAVLEQPAQSLYFQKLLRREMCLLNHSFFFWHVVRAKTIDMKGRVLEQIGNYHHTDLFVHCDGWSNRLSVWRMRSRCRMSKCPNVICSFILTTILSFSTSSAERLEKGSNFLSLKANVCSMQAATACWMLYAAWVSMARLLLIWPKASKVR